MWRAYRLELLFAEHLSLAWRLDDNAAVLLEGGGPREDDAQPRGGVKRLVAVDLLERLLVAFWRRAVE